MTRLSDHSCVKPLEPWNDSSYLSEGDKCRRWFHVGTFTRAIFLKESDAIQCSFLSSVVCFYSANLLKTIFSVFSKFPSLSKSASICFVWLFLNEDRSLTLMKGAGALCDITVHLWSEVNIEHTLWKVTQNVVMKPLQSDSCCQQQQPTVWWVGRIRHRFQTERFGRRLKTEG